MKQEREFHFTQSDFARVCQLIYEHAGISLGEMKFSLLLHIQSLPLNDLCIVCMNSRIQKRSAIFIAFERQAGVASVLLKRPSKRNTNETLQAAYH